MKFRQNLPGLSSFSNRGSKALRVWKFCTVGKSYPITPLDSNCPESRRLELHSRAANKDSPEFPGTAPPGFCGRNGFAWGNYLFHYTRACPGPWPGQAYHEYLADLLDGRSLSGHSAFDTLIRIMEERLIRAGSRIELRALCRLFPGVLIRRRSFL